VIIRKRFAMVTYRTVTVENPYRSSHSLMQGHRKVQQSQ
jgi:hypothetical protein